MGGIDEELHLGLFQVCLAAALVCIDNIQDDACYDQDIEEICLGGCIPRVAYLDVDDGRILGISAIAGSSHLQRIVARFQLVECYGIGSLIGAVPFAIVDAVLETDIISVPVVEQ